MEEVFQRFPDLTEKIYAQLDNQSLVRCNEVSRSWKSFLGNKKLLPIRKIMEYVGHKEQFSVHWGKVLSKTSTLFIQELAKAVSKFFQESLKELDLEDAEKQFPNFPLSPLHVCAALNNLQMFQIVFVKVKDKNPVGEFKLLRLNFKFNKSRNTFET